MKALLRPKTAITLAVLIALAMLVSTCRARYVINFMYDSNPPEMPWSMPTR